MVYNKEVQTVEGSFEPQGPTEQELREKIKEELAKEEQLRLEILEAERLEAEAAIPQEVPGMQLCYILLRQGKEMLENCDILSKDTIC